MTGTDSIREAEYRALMDLQREHERTAQWTWNLAILTATALLAIAIPARHPGMLMPVEICVALGFHATVQGRRRTRLIAGYVREFFEKERDGGQWFTRFAALRALPGGPGRTDWVPLAVSNALMIMAVGFAWGYAGVAAHGELLAGLVTTLGLGFAVHSLVETLRLEPPATAASWSQLGTNLREVPPGSRTASTR